MLVEDEAEEEEEEEEDGVAVEVVAVDVGGSVDEAVVAVAEEDVSPCELALVFALEVAGSVRSVPCCCCCCCCWLWSKEGSAASSKLSSSLT